MDEIKLGVVESQFADIIWSNEPIPSGELVKLCEKDVYVISYNDSMLEDGSFTTLLDRVFGEK